MLYHVMTEDGSSHIIMATTIDEAKQTEQLGRVYSAERINMRAFDSYSDFPLIVDIMDIDAIKSHKCSCERDVKHKGYRLYHAMLCYSDGGTVACVVIAKTCKAAQDAVNDLLMFSADEITSAHIHIVPTEFDGLLDGMMGNKGAQVLTNLAVPA